MLPDMRTVREPPRFKPKSLKVCSFFAGVGFLDFGFELCDYDVMLVNEIHPPFLESYKYARTHLNLPPPKLGYHAGDVSEFLTPAKQAWLTKHMAALRQEGAAIGFIGGPPCPDFSVGGKNKGQEGDRGKLSATYVQLICAAKPDFFLFENVKGLWKTFKHRAFYDEMKAALIDGGYAVTDRLINAIEYGAPQNRERIILIGFNEAFLHRLKPNAPILGGQLATFPWRARTRYRAEKVLALPWQGVQPFKEHSRTRPPSGVPVELTVEHWFRKNRVDSHPNAKDGFRPRNGKARMSRVGEGDDSRKSFKRLHRWRYSPTVAYGNNEVHLHPYLARRISVAEALALQSLPKEFQLPPDVTLSNKFKMTGNGVPYLAARGLALTIKDFLEG